MHHIDSIRQGRDFDLQCISREVQISSWTCLSHYERRRDLYISISHSVKGRLKCGSFHMLSFLLFQILTPLQKLIVASKAQVCRYAY